MAFPHKTIARIKRMLTETMETTDKSFLVLYHLNVATRRTSIGSERNWSDPETAAADMWERAKDHAQSMGGPQRFQLSSYDLADDGNEHPIRTVVFNLDQGFSTMSDEPTGSETPDATGLVAQSMRHTETMFRQHSAAIGALTHHLASTVEKLTKQNEFLMGERMREQQVREELLSRKHERDMDMDRQREGNARKKEMFEKVVQMLPLVVNKITGKEIVRQKTSALESTMMAFMETITPRHLDQLAGSGLLDHRQLLLFSTILEQMTKTMIAADEKREQLETAQKAMNNELANPVVS